MTMIEMCGNGVMAMLLFIILDRLLLASAVDERHRVRGQTVLCIALALCMLLMTFRSPKAMFQQIFGEPPPATVGRLSARTTLSDGNSRMVYALTFATLDVTGFRILLEHQPETQEWPISGAGSAAIQPLINHTGLFGQTDWELARQMKSPKAWAWPLRTRPGDAPDPNDATALVVFDEETHAAVAFRGRFPVGPPASLTTAPATQPR
jgi:hypothetical protein